MIDFRFLLTTIVAVFLALAIGLLIGSGLLAQPLAENLEEQVHEVVDRNNELRDRILQQQARLDSDETFGLQVQPMLINGELSGDSVVLIRFEGTDGALIDRLREAVEVADGSVSGTITIRDKFALEDPDAVEDLTQILSEYDLEPPVEELIPAAARELGDRAANDAAVEAGDPLFPTFAQALIDEGFIEIDVEPEVAMGPRADFVVAAGSTGERPYDVTPLAEALLTELAGDGSEVVAVEGWQSEWSFVPDLRGSDVRDVVSTVDHADTVPGAIAVVLELDRIPSGDTGHYGFRDGADGVTPELPGGG